MTEFNRAQRRVKRAMRKAIGKGRHLRAGLRLGREIKLMARTLLELEASSQAERLTKT